MLHPVHGPEDLDRLEGDKNVRVFLWSSSRSSDRGRSDHDMGDNQREKFKMNSR